MKKFFALLACFSLVLLSCSDDNEVPEAQVILPPNPPTPTSGSANFSSYVAIGNSLTAGYSDNALFIAGQQASFPNMLAGQFALAGGGAFTQPLMADNLGGMTLNGNPISGNRLFLSFAGGSPAPVPVTGQGGTEITTRAAGAPYNNMGVPGAKSYHLLAPNYGNVAGVPLGLANPYFARMASAPNATVFGDALASNPTFFTLWIGNNDVLGYAASGGAGVNQLGNLDAATYGGSDISDPNVVAFALNTMLQQLTSMGADGVVANIPDITSAPYFTTVPFAPLSPANPAFAPQIPVLNAQFAGLNAAWDFLQQPNRKITFATDAASAVIIKDESLPNLATQLTQVLIGGGLDAGTATILGLVYGQARQATAADLIVLPSSSIIAQSNASAVTFLTGLGVDATTAGQLSINGITWPLEDRWVLTPAEQMEIDNAVIAFNQKIEEIAVAYNIPVFDANALLNTVINQGIDVSGVNIGAAFATGGAFSLDGIHPSPRGYALIANAMIDVINQNYGATLTPVNPLAFAGVYIN